MGKVGEAPVSLTVGDGFAVCCSGAVGVEAGVTVAGFIEVGEEVSACWGGAFPGS